MSTPNYELETEPTRVEALIGGRYRLVSILGEGGMGTVYRARGRGDHFVALKVMKPELETSPRARRRFLRECELLERIESPYVVRVYDAGLAPAGELYLAMELLDGRPLGDVVHEGPIASFAQIAKIAEQIALGVAAAHALDVVHRDLKPDNVFLMSDGGVRVLDFGIARLVDPPHLDRGTGKLTSTGAILGTPGYISPEGAAGEPVTAAADLYSLGVLLFELITGRLPFEADLPLVMMTMHLTEPAPDVRTFRPETPDALANLVALLLEKTPANRPNSALAVARELGRCNARGEAETREASPVQPTPPFELQRVHIQPPRPAVKSRALPAALGALAVLTLVGAGIAIWAGGDGIGPGAQHPPEPRDAPSIDAPSQDAPSIDAPSQDAPSQDAPSQDAPSQDAPAEELPATVMNAEAATEPTVEAPPAEVPSLAPPASRPSGRRGRAVPAAGEPEVEPEPTAPRPGQLLEYGM